MNTNIQGKKVAILATHGFEESELTIAPWCMCLASFGRYSLIRTPSAEVGMALVGPWVSAPGLTSKVSRWLIPPLM